VPKKKLLSTISATASHKSPGPAKPSAAVPSAQPSVARASSRFLAPCRSAQAPSPGALTTIKAYDSANAEVQARLAQSALPAITDTK
jgi:hypothetical protein